MVVSIIGRKPEYPVENNNLPQITETLFRNVVSNTPHHEWDLKSQLKWWLTLIAQVVVNSITIQSLRPPMFYILPLTI